MGKLLIPGLWILGLCTFFGFISPTVIDRIVPGWERLDKIQEEHGLDNALLYYTDLPIIQEAEEATRRAVRQGMQARREATLAQHKVQEAQAVGDSPSK